MKDRPGMRRGAALSMLALCVALAVACSTTSRKMAGEGAKSGAAEDVPGVLNGRDEVVVQVHGPLVDG